MLKASLRQAHPLKESKNTTPLPKRVRGIIANAFKKLCEKFGYLLFDKEIIGDDVVVFII